MADRPGKLYWVDRKGAAKEIEVGDHPYADPKISPDGKHVALTLRTAYPNTEINVLDLARGTLTRITFTKPGDYASRPIWTPDGKRIIYSAMDGSRLTWRPADGSGAEESLYSDNELLQAVAVLPDGRLLFSRGNLTSATDLWLLNLNGDRKATPLLVDKLRKTTAQVSPDGHWLAYDQSTEDLAPGEVYVQPLPGLEGKYQISTAGGEAPVWSRDGKELFYRAAGGKVMVVDVQTKPKFAAGIPRMLFEGTYRSSPTEFYYDVAPDGQRFLMIKDDAAAEGTEELRVVLNWTEELKSRVGAAKK